MKTPLFSTLALGLLALFSGCSKEETGFDNHPGRDPDQALQSSHGKSGGPVEHIDAKERREAALLVPTIGPVQREMRLYRADIRSAFEEENFDFLEEQAEEARSGLPTFGSGSTRIVQFYQGVANRYSDGRDQLILDNERIQRWIAEKPDSATARIAMGNLMVDTAWVVRGSGWAKTVSEEQWKLFYQLLAGAQEGLTPLINETMPDPYAGTVMMKVALGQGWSLEEYETMLEVLETRFPSYWGYYTQRAYSLLPRWHGEKGDWEAYAQGIADTKGEFGEEVYARILFNLVGFYGNIFRETGAQWNTAREGVLQLLEKYPDSLELLSCSARLATLGRDRELANQLFEQLGDQYVEDCWANPEQFVHYRTWARTGEW